MIKRYVHIKNMLLFMLLFMVSLGIVGCTGNEIAPVAKETKAQQALENTTGQPKGTDALKADTALKAETLKVIVYHATPDAHYLMPEVHTVPKPASMAQTALEILLAGTANKELFAVVPQGTKLRSVTIKNHIAYADFSEALVKNGGGSTNELLLVGAIVNTLTELPDVQKVQIIIEGKKVDTLSGHVDISQPLNRMERLIKKGA